MKKILLTVSTAAILLTACNSDKKDSLSTDKQVVFSDTSSLNKSNPGTDVPAAGATTPAVTPDPATAAAPPQVRTVTKYITVHDKPRTNAPATTTNTTPPVATQSPASSAPPSTDGGTTGTSTTGTETGSTTGTTTGTTPATVPAKKNTGWSQTAKDATIGGVGGAVIGAVIGKGAKGAVIGGVIGAAGGYILGRKADKASGRVGTTTTTGSTAPPQ